MGKLTDNLVKVMHGQLVHSGTDPQSEELDFDLPRGFVAKVKEVTFEHYAPSGVPATADVYAVRAALIRDPDDASSIQVPVNTVQHDVVMSTVFFLNHITDLNIMNQWRASKKFNQEEDVITARNMRFNTDSDNVASNGYITDCYVYYTLEKVSKTEILELLDIL